MFGRDTDETIVTGILEQSLPPLLAYLESITPATGVLFEHGVSIADIAVGTCFLQARYGDFEPDAATYPRLAAYLDRTLGSELVKARMEREAADVRQLAS